MRRLALVVAATVLLGGCTADGPTVAPSPIPSPSITGHEPNALRPFYDQRANWSDCGQFECATIAAPLAYDRPAGRRIRLSMLKRPADNQSDKIGTLFVNPGGPGVSGIQYARLAEVLFTQPVLENYDIVGWDPRGVGASTAISCLTDSQTDRLLAADGTPDNATEVATLVRLNTSF